MIKVMLRFGGDIILVVIEGNKIQFGNTAYGAQFTTIDGLKLSHEGVIKEFPDLKGVKKWRENAISRFKGKIKELKTEKEKANYIIEDLRKFGYVPFKLEESGKRPVNIK